VDEDARRFRVAREGRALVGHVMQHGNGFFTIGEGWDPPPVTLKPNPQWHMQYHLRFTPAGYAGRRVLGVVLCPVLADGVEPHVSTERVGGLELARFEADWVAVSEGTEVGHDGKVCEGIAMISLAGCVYGIGAAGVAEVGG